MGLYKIYNPLTFFNKKVINHFSFIDKTRKIMTLKHVIGMKLANLLSIFL